MPQPDQSNYLAHFTKGEDPMSNLEAMLREKKITAKPLPWTNLPAVCLTECPWPSLIFHARNYSPYGIGFTKPHVFAAGGGPAYYVRADHWVKQKWQSHVKAFVTPFWPEYRPEALKTQEYLNGKTIDYAHEREWRVPHDFSFQYNQVAFVTVATYQDMAKFPKDLKDQIGRDRFIITEIYENIERLWPTHNL